ncbi:MAG: S-adenosylmethionine:tRNA ribosyltransferase-isomerase [Candidatus Eisenbacteria bacterium]|uniref:S-adenosylmethionine:tRNA ribosyltransferase-isomerase n=1 Tax=Eiseniibacteriota bacterium TaxID=2212470 RepID=A0A7Y2ECF6_UNCEI|nr:S-adenosylmethionine:tRNA ribosyltransferase-isomerase [Candidatus Eisenbacteria bacterium]
MRPASGPSRDHGKLMTLDSSGNMDVRSRKDVGLLFEPGDVVVANTAATLPASLQGLHVQSGQDIEIRLAGWVEAYDVTRFKAVAFGAGDYRVPTEHRLSPPTMRPGDRLRLGPLRATVQAVLDHSRLLELRFQGDRKEILAGLARHGRPIQYAYVPKPLELWDVWTHLAAEPIAFESPSAGFALSWDTLSRWQKRGIAFATLSHAAGISSTGDPDLDQRLPLDEPYEIPPRTAAAINKARLQGNRVIAIGTTVVRALEAATCSGCVVRSGLGVARNLIGASTNLCTVDAIVTGVHEHGESHYELLRAFADTSVLESMNQRAAAEDFQAHEFGDSMLIERQARAKRSQAV